jgi:integral membrane sensor domain MASE1
MNPSKKYFSYFLQIIVCATIYFLCGKYGLLFPYAKGNISPLWPPAGIAIAIILLKGPQFLPAIFLGGFMTTFSTNVPVVASIAVGIGNMLEALIGNIIFIQRNGSVRLDKLKDIFTLIIIAIIAPLVATIIGTYSLYWTGIVGYNELKAAVELWYFGDALGIIVFTPLIITWFSYSVSKKNTMQFIEAIAAFCALIASSTITFRVYTDIKYSVIITLVWLAIRFGARSVTLASFIVTTILLYFTFRGEGPFTQYTPHLNLIFLQLFVAAISLTALILSAITTEQKKYSQTTGRNK